MENRRINDSELEKVSGGFDSSDEQIIVGAVLPGSSAGVLPDGTDSGMTTRTKDPRSAQRSEN